MGENEYSEAGKAIRDTMQGSAASAWIRGLIGGIVGAVAGYYVFWFFLNNGMYAGMLPGSMIGVGFAFASRRSSILMGIACGIAGLIFGLWCDGATNDPPQNLIEYLKDYQRIPDANRIMIGLGAIVSFWIGKGR